ncbi:hypothetical protein H6F53_08705 [Trichocoleus sp. FACHB-832]|uniref:hypothetical protein n=1 Tax=Trichocoleus sp. FACHB-832 TaxID=2692875 RepID=UPI0016836D97|nr:hypothetical protein [Trichocoleus sp. FACHB-832]MBD1905564.1 hypothetical protein [Trichocoleus sp. FACHB-832]
MSLSIPLVFSQKLGCLAPVAQSRFHSFGPSFQGSPVGKVVYDDVETERTPVRSPIEKGDYSGLEENPLSAPIESSGFIEKDS